MSGTSYTPLPLHPHPSAEQLRLLGNWKLGDEKKREEASVFCHFFSMIIICQSSCSRALEQKKDLDWGDYWGLKSWDDLHERQIGWICKLSEQSSSDRSSWSGGAVQSPSRRNACFKRRKRKMQQWCKKRWYGVTHGSTRHVLDGDRELPWVATFGEHVLARCRESVDPPIKGLKVHVTSHRALACWESGTFTTYLLQNHCKCALLHRTTAALYKHFGVFFLHWLFTAEFSPRKWPLLLLFLHINQQFFLSVNMEPPLSLGACSTLVLLHI